MSLKDGWTSPGAGQIQALWAGVQLCPVDQTVRWSVPTWRTSFPADGMGFTSCCGVRWMQLVVNDSELQGETSSPFTACSRRECCAAPPPRRLCKTGEPAWRDRGVTVWLHRSSSSRWWRALGQDPLWSLSSTVFFQRPAPTDQGEPNVSVYGGSGPPFCLEPLPAALQLLLQCISLLIAFGHYNVILQTEFADFVAITMKYNTTKNSFLLN